MTDGQLLDRFINVRDADAFAELVRRHGPMVLATCRRVTRSEQDAEDAFQAAFLVLAHKARAVQPRDLVGNWLYGVAARTARKIAGLAGRRRVREKQVAIMPDPPPKPDEDMTELVQLLDKELERLPERYRAAVVLCELEGRSRRDAARLLGVPEGTLSSRLAAARRRLAAALARRGVMPAAVVAALGLARSASARVPDPVAAAAVRAARLAAAGRPLTGAVSARALAAAGDVVKALVASTLRSAAVLGVFGVTWLVGPDSPTRSSRGTGSISAVDGFANGPVAERALVLDVRFPDEHGVVGVRRADRLLDGLVPPGGPPGPHVTVAFVSGPSDSPAGSAPAAGVVAVTESPAGPGRAAPVGSGGQ